MTYITDTHGGAIKTNAISGIEVRTTYSVMALRGWMYLRVLLMLLSTLLSASCLTSFFFFKQKTAYEMRISDWSSDVCSSDLRLTGRARGMGTGPRTGP